MLSQLFSFVCHPYSMHQIATIKQIDTNTILNSDREHSSFSTYPPFIHLENSANSFHSLGHWFNAQYSSGLVLPLLSHIHNIHIIFQAFWSTIFCSLDLKLWNFQGITANLDAHNTNKHDEEKSYKRRHALAIHTFRAPNMCTVIINIHKNDIFMCHKMFRFIKNHFPFRKIRFRFQLNLYIHWRLIFISSIYKFIVEIHRFCFFHSMKFMN